MNEREVNLGSPVVGAAELKNISEVFETGWILNGPEVDAFEDEFAEYVSADNAVSVVNCTAGMDMAIKALGLVGKRVIVPGQSFIANGIALLQNNVEPIFVDVRSDTYNIDETQLEAHAAEADGILLLHYAGHPADMETILEIAASNELAVIEDAAHALGSTYQGTPIGTFGDATVFSFGPLKMITTAMGGMVTTPHKRAAERIQTLRSYGMDNDAWKREKSRRSWQYSVPELGHNFRLTDTAAAMGRAQLERLDDFVEHRKSRAADYTERLRGIDGIQPPTVMADAQHSYLYYVIRVDDTYGLSRDELAALMKDNGVEVSVHWDPPLHEHVIVSERVNDVSLPTSERLANQLMTLPMHPKLSREDIEYVTSIISSHA